MSAQLDDRRLAEVLPGSWRIAATSQHSWLTGERLAPHIDIDLHSRRPLSIVHRARWQTIDGVEVESTSRSVRRGETFSRRGSGKHYFQRSAWHVGGVDPSGTVLTLHVTRSFEFLPGIDIIVRDGAEPEDVRSVVANSTEAYGLSPSEFATLTWLPR